ncbi:MAG: FAD binding domain-containing protein [Gammaproteobacteria bacterium]
MLNPTNIPDAAGELRRLGDQATIYSGGAELVLLLRHRMIQIEYLVNIKRISGLEEILWDRHALYIGAAVTHHRLETNALVRRYYPMFAYAESQIANIRVRNQGTLGGNLCFSDPHSDPGTVLLVYEAMLKLGSITGERHISLDDFLVGMYATALMPDEILIGIEVPPLPPGWGSAFLRVHHFQRPTVNVAAAAFVEGGNISRVRLAVGCIGPRPVRLSELESRVRGLTVDDAKTLISGLSQYLFEQLKPIDDLLGSKEYKIYMAKVLLGRTLEQAAQNRGDNTDG